MLSSNESCSCLFGGLTGTILFPPAGDVVRAGDDIFHVLIQTNTINGPDVYQQDLDDRDALQRSRFVEVGRRAAISHSDIALADGNNVGL